jgi:uncharacterized membrane protein YgaE (UPF0421/DUF939 family)
MSARMRATRVREAWRSVLQLSVGAALAWLIATELVGHERPFFAPVAAVVTVGVTLRERQRRAAELALGIALGDLLVLGIGTGPAQIALVVGLVTCAALLTGTGQLLANQAAISAILVATLEPPTDGITFARFLDALIGGGVGLAVSALLLPVDRVALMRRAAAPALAELGGALRDIAAALDAGDEAAAERALLRARATEGLIGGFTDAVDVAREGLRSRDEVERFEVAAAHVELAIRSVRVLARGAMRACALEEHVPPGVGAALRDLADGVEALSRVLAEDADGDPVVGPALRAATQAGIVFEQTGNLSVSVLVGQIRSTATELLRSVGYDYAEATTAVRAAAAEATA